MQPRDEQRRNSEGVAVFEEFKGALEGGTEVERQEKRGSNDYR